MKTERRQSVKQRRIDEGEVMEIREQIANTLQLAQEAAGRVSTHEAVCAERFAGILARFSRAEKVVYAGGMMLIGGMGTVIVMLIGLLTEK